MSRVVLLGATGLVGGHALQLLLDDARCSAVIAPTRRALSVQHAKLDAPLIDFDAPADDAALWSADAVICALGTTMKHAGSREAFRRIDHGYPLKFAQLARRHGTPAFVLNSAKGANPDSRIFYNQIKGELERDLSAMAWPSLSLVRPGLIDGERGESRPGEDIGLVFSRLFNPVLPRGWRSNPATRIARVMVDAALAVTPGLHIVESDQLIAKP